MKSMETTICLDNMSMTHVRLLAEICKNQSGFEINPDIWAFLVENYERLTTEAQREGSDDNIAWMRNYINEAWDEITLDAPGYLMIANLLDEAAEYLSKHPDSLHKAGEFYALARAAAIFLEDETPLSAEQALPAIYAHYGIDY